jgi:hypothetical protein
VIAAWTGPTKACVFEAAPKAVALAPVPSASDDKRRSPSLLVRSHALEREVERLLDEKRYELAVLLSQTLLELRVEAELVDTSLVGAEATCVVDGAISPKRFLDTFGPLHFPEAPLPQRVPPEPGTTPPPSPPKLAVAVKSSHLTATSKASSTTP